MRHVLASSCTALGRAVSEDDGVPFHVTTLEVTAGLGVLTSGLAFTGAMLALAQKARTDRHDAWWKRAQWAIDRSLSDDPATRTVGTEAMNVLSADATAAPADLEVLDAAVVRALDRS